MSSDRWEKIEEIYHAALKLEGSQRASFLDQVCQDDGGLRREVESLLASDAQAGDFIESPAIELVARGMTDLSIPSLAGRQFGTYQILSVLGAGGMGEVYKARDTRLNRNVAIKVLSRQLTERADLRQRFEREAHLLASLNHPNIASIYGLEESSGFQALVMELVEGPTLAERVADDPIPVDEALRIARQMAEALEYAHEKGIIHRDLKPANVKVTVEGVVKLLDFGLAKALEGGTTSGDLENSPRLTVAATEKGVILGTAAYMAPEQARGSVVDKRADIWSFGVVFYEMLTGKRLFQAETVSDTMASVLKLEPDWNALPSEVPAAIRKLLRRCLAKERRERLQAVGDARIEITECLLAPAGAAEAEPMGLKPIAVARRRETLAWLLVAVLLVALGVGAISYMLRGQAPAHAVVAQVLPPQGTQFNFEYSDLSSGPALSPDGRTLAFSAVDVNGKAMLWIRPLNSNSARLLAGTEGANVPFWSANSQSIGFYSDEKLKTIEASGGPALIVSDAEGPFGASWNHEGTLLLSYYGKGLYQVAGSGGTSVPVLQLDTSKHRYYACPHFLPDGKHFLYGAVAISNDRAATETYFASLDSKENTILVRGGDHATYASGFLLYIRDSRLMAQGLDPERGRLLGDPHVLAERVSQAFDVSENGVLIYQVSESRGNRLTWFDRTGKELGVVGEAGPYGQVRFSPDGSKLAFDKGVGNIDLWVDELARGVRMRLTNDPGTDKGIPVWSPDGSRILFGALSPKAQLGIYVKPSNGAGGQELLLSSETSDAYIWPTSWSSDGKFILYSRGDLPVMKHAEIWVMPVDSDRKPRLFVPAAYDGQFSPNGRWVAYTSKESGREEVYIVPFEAAKVVKTAGGSITSPAGKWLVSPSGGRSPRWLRNGKEIFYLAPGGQMMAVEVDEKDNSLEVRKALPLFKAAVSGFLAPYDVAPDGKRFIINTESQNDNAPLTLVVNWTDLLGNKP